MKQIQGSQKTIRELFTGVKYRIHYYQREYQWRRKQIEELVEDLSEEFFNNYDDEHERNEVEHYGHYFMGSVVLTEDDNAIIDGQQRLTSLSLLLLYLSKQLEGEDNTEVMNLIFSQKYGKKTFNIDVEERAACLEAIMNDSHFEPEGHPESVVNIWNRYNDIAELMHDKLESSQVPFFKDWLIDNVQFIRIVATTEQDAHKIFVSMNDRGLSLTSAEMLKGYLLSEIADNDIRQKANDLWKERIVELKNLGKEEESDFLKTWLRAKYAESIRERKKNAEAGDFDLIATAFHKWVRENHISIGLKRSADYEQFILNDFMKYSSLYIRIKEYSKTFTKGFEYVFYNADRNFTLQPLLLLSAIEPDDSKEVADAKLRVVSVFLDQLMTLRIFNFKTLDYSGMAYTIFILLKRLRGKSVQELADILTSEVEDYQYSLDGAKDFHWNIWSARYIRHQLTRITHFIESSSGRDSDFSTYVNRRIKNPYDVEHIWSVNESREGLGVRDEKDFEDSRNLFGGLILLPQDFNRSYGDLPYKDKVGHYIKNNLLAASLNEKAYQNNPQFLSFIREAKLDFCHYEHFTKESLEQRQNLYFEICKMIWNPRLIQAQV